MTGVILMILRLIQSLLLKTSKRFIEHKTGFKEAEPYSSTDITILCGKICGVNLSIGYDYEHTPDEILVYKDWKRTLDIVRKMLEEPQKKFPLLTF